MRRILSVDHVFVGSGLINLLYGSYLGSLGRTVLIIERSCDLGGSWAPINFGDWSSVENAVHYLLPNSQARWFVTNVLDLPVERQRKKVELIWNRGEITKTHHLGRAWSSPWALKHSWGRTRLKVDSKQHGFKPVLSRAQAFVSEAHGAWYPIGGSPALVASCISLAHHANVDFLFNTDVKKVNFQNDYASIDTLDLEVRASSVILSEGCSNLSLVDVEDEISLSFPNTPVTRPQLHLTVLDSGHCSAEQFIVRNHDSIKYVHNVTKYAISKNQGRTLRQQIFTVATATSSPARVNKTQIFEALKQLKIVNSKAQLIDYKHWDAKIPNIQREELFALSHRFYPKLRVLPSENLAHGLGLISRYWRRSLPD